jgi:hypothetical protein
MVSVKGAVKELQLTVFPLVVHVPAGDTELTLNPDGNLSTRVFASVQVTSGVMHRAVMVKVIRCPTVTVLGVAILSKHKPALQGSCARACCVQSSIAPLTTSTTTAANADSTMVLRIPIGLPSLAISYLFP